MPEDRPTRPTSPREVRESLPRGWVLGEDGVTPRRDRRMLFREGWMLALCLVCFGAAAIGLFWWSFPSGRTGWLKLVAALFVLLLAGGIAAPILTRALSRRRNLLLLALILLASCGTKARDVELLDLSGAAVRPLESIQGKALVLVFVSIDCPNSNRYLPELRQIAADVRPKGVDFRLVYADASQEATAIRKHLAEHEVDLTALRDTRHALARFSGVRVTPEAAVFLPGGRLAYRGRIDDRFVAFGKAKPAPTRRDLALALEEILAGRQVTVPRSENVIGCPIP